MSVKILAEVLDYAPVTGDELVVLIVLADSCNEDRVCWPGEKTLERRASLGWRVLDTILKDLELQGIIQIELRKRKNSNIRSSNMYTIFPVSEWLVLQAYELFNPRPTGLREEAVERDGFPLYRVEGESGSARSTGLREKAVEEPPIDSNPLLNTSALGSAARVVHVDYAPYTLYIGRSMPSKGLSKSKWANLTKISEETPRARAIQEYTEYLLSHPALIRALPEIRGQVLGCWCKTPDDPDCPCHGDVLIKYAALPDEEIEKLAQAAEQNPIVNAIAEHLLGYEVGKIPQGQGGYLGVLAKVARESFAAVYKAHMADGWTRERKEQCGWAVEQFVADWRVKNKDVHLPTGEISFGKAFLKYLTEKSNGKAGKSKNPLWTKRGERL